MTQQPEEKVMLEEAKEKYKDGVPVSDVEYTYEPTDKEGNFVCDHCHFAFTSANFNAHTEILAYLKPMRKMLGPSTFKHETEQTDDHTIALKVFRPNNPNPWLCWHCGIYFNGAGLKSHLESVLEHKLKVKGVISTKK
jgi:hypothetical protein